MDKTQTVVSRPMNRILAGVDVLFFLSISFIIASLIVVISLR
jgi:hypothetical protein